MTGSSSSGSSQTTSEQPYILSGISQQAAQSAGEAQISAANIAAQAATQNSQNAIQSLMGEYQTALTYANPGINTGNQAAAQMNYMLGLPAVNPGKAPTAPTAPSLSADESAITQAQITQYINANTGLDGPIPLPTQGGSKKQDKQNAATNAANPQEAYYSGVGAGGGQLTLQQLYGASYNNPTLPGNSAISSDIIQTLADPVYQAQESQYNTENTQYQDQLAQYDQQQNLYNTYSAMGTPTAANINNIISSQPGFQFNQEQGINAIQNAGSASGMLNSGNILEQLNQFGQGLSEQYYQNYMGNLATLAGIGTQDLTGVQSASAGVGNAISGEDTNIGSSQANADLAAGQADASIFTSPVANQQVMMYPYQTTSNTTSNSSSSGGIGGILGSVGQVAGLFCSRELKTSYGSVNTHDILNSVNQLSLDKWSYKGIDQEHIGPYAEEFKELFGVGDGHTINMIDLFGVLIGAVKELSLKVKELQEGK